MGGYDRTRILRVLIISAVLFGAFVLLRPYGLEWMVIPGGLLVALLIILLALVRNARMKKRLEDIQREIDALEEKKQER
jgi:hypothetical protein